MKLLRTICVLGLALCLATSVYAGTQSVKISGDLTIRGIARGDYDLNRHHAEADVPNTPSATEQNADPVTGTSDWASLWQSTAEIQLDADLTDNVSAVLRLFNQRDWDVRNKNAATANLTTIYTQNADEFDVGLDLAYIELKEFLYSPLTLRIGRQDLWFGRGFIVGANLRDYNMDIASAPEYTAMRSFDAFRATLDYEPWTIDAVAAVIWNNDINSRDDEDLLGVNVGYVFDMFNAEAEAYWFNKTDRGTVPARNIKDHNYVNTVGIRGSADPLENFTLAAEGAYQFGRFVGFRDQYESRKRNAWAIDASAECRYFKEMFPWKPVMGAEYIFYSGDKKTDPTPHTTGDYTGWDYMYRGKFDTAYREWIGTYYATHMGTVYQNVNYIDRYPDLSRNNQHQILLYGSVMPIESITLDGKLGFFWQQFYREFAKIHTEGTARTGLTAFQVPDRAGTFLGTEFDFGLTWDYTEDVSFGLLAAWFWPGDFYYGPSSDTATDIVGTVKLSF